MIELATPLCAVSHWVSFGLGAFLGAWISLVAIALCVAAKRPTPNFAAMVEASKAVKK